MFSRPTSEQPASRTAATTKARITTMAAMLAVAGAASIALAGPAAAATNCSSGHFCAYQDANLIGLLLDSTAGRGSNHVDVANDRVSSGNNVTGNQWDGVSARTFLPDELVFRFAPRTVVRYVGNSANDKIDHFNVR